MVFNLNSKKKKSSKIPKLTSKVRVQVSSQRNVTVTNNLIMTPIRSQNHPDPSLYNKLSSSRAIFESKKLESACTFLRSLKEKLENDIREPDTKLDKKASDVITDILDALIDVSDNITPIVSDVSDSTKSLYRNSTLDSPSISEKQFNKTMAATSKLLELSKISGMPATMTDGAYYYAHKIIASNLEELKIFGDSMQSIGDKIYVDKKLLKQLIHLHKLLQDTIVKLRNQEEKFEHCNDAEVYFTGETSNDSTKNESPTPSNPPVEKMDDLYKTFPLEPYVSANNLDDSTEMATAMDTSLPEEHNTAVDDSTKTSTVEPIDNSVRANPETAGNLDDSARMLTPIPPPLATSTPKHHVTTKPTPEVVNTENLFVKKKSKKTKAKSESAVKSKAPGGKSKTLPHETQNANDVSGIPIFKKDPSIKANKMKRKERRASKGSIENASLLGVEIPQAGVDYDKTEPEEGIKSQTPSEIKPPETPKQIVVSEISGKTFVSRSTETSITAFPVPRRKHLRTVTSGSRDAATCCDNKQASLKSVLNQTDNLENRSTPMVSHKIHKPAILKSVFNQTDNLENLSTPMVSDKTHKPAVLKSAFNQTDNVEKETDPSRPTSSAAKFGKACLPKGTICEAIGTLRGKIVCKDCSAKKKLSNSGESDLEKTIESPITDKTQNVVNKQSNVNFKDDLITEKESKDIGNISKSYAYCTSKHFNTSVPGYFEGLNKWIAELECMRNCLRQAVVSGTDVHDCIKIFPEEEEECCESEFPHFHTTMDGIPMVIQINKTAIPLDDSLGDETLSCCRKQSAGKNQPCCQETGPHSKQSRSQRIWETISKTAHERWVPSRWKKSILRLGNQNKSSPVQSLDNEANSSEMGDYTTSYKDDPEKSKLSYDMDTIREDYYVQKTEYNLNAVSPGLVGDDSSSPSMPYVAATTSLPKMDDPNKICSSLKFDVKTVPVTFENSVLYHPDEGVNRALRDIKVEELLDSSRPAKCCRKTVLNEKPRSTMPYAASLKSLPLVISDVQTIYRTMQKRL